MIAPKLAQRVWRVRKNHTWIDAQVLDDGDTGAAEIRFYYDGVMVFARRWPSRDAALTHADDRLRELQRAGWVTHW
jgi:hypothetical protein